MLATSLMSQAAPSDSVPCSSGDGISFSISQLMKNRNLITFVFEITLGEEDVRTDQFKVSFPHKEYQFLHFSAVGKSKDSIEAFDSISNSILIIGKQQEDKSSTLQIAYRGTIYTAVCPL